MNIKYPKLCTGLTSLTYFRFTFSFVLSTVSPSGILFYTESDNGKRLYLAFSGSLLTLTSDMGTSPLRVASVARINDGLPHKVCLFK